MWTFIAACVSCVPVMLEPGSSVPESRIITDVAVQIRIVSMKTPRD